MGPELEAALVSVSESLLEEPVGDGSVDVGGDCYVDERFSVVVVAE